MCGLYCSRAPLVTGSTVTGTNMYATFEAGETALNYASSDPSSRRTVWYQWTAASAGTYTVSTATSGFDTLLGVYEADGAAGLSRIRNVSLLGAR